VVMGVMCDAQAVMCAVQNRYMKAKWTWTIDRLNESGKGANGRTKYVQYRCTCVGF
jgi:hypothetical protein